MRLFVSFLVGTRSSHGRKPGVIGTLQAVTGGVIHMCGERVANGTENVVSAPGMHPGNALDRSESVRTESSVYCNRSLPGVIDFTIVGDYTVFI